MGTFQQLIRNLTPGYMRGPNGGTFLEAQGLALDELAERTYQGMRTMIPYAGGAVDAGGVALECSPAFLSMHAKDRGIRTYDSESLLGRRVRISRWHQFKRQRGTAQGALFNTQPFFLGTGLALPTIRIVHQSANASRSYPATWHTVDPSGVYSRYVATPGNWNWDNQPAKWARWWAIMYLPAGWAGNPLYNDGGTYNSPERWDGLTTLQATDLIGALREGGETPGNRLAGFITTTLTPASDVGGALAFDPASYAITLPNGATTLPTGNWGLPQYRPPWADFLYDNAG